MSRYSIYSVLMAGSISLFCSCTKVQQEILLEEASKKKPKSLFSGCAAISFVSQSEGMPVIERVASFRSNVLPNENKVSTIIAGISQGGAITDSIEVNLLYEKERIVFLHADRSTDTLLVALLNKKGLVSSVLPGNAASADYLPVRLEYKGTEISSLVISFNGEEIESEFIYDHKGNLKSVIDRNEAGQITSRVDYEYNLAVKASQQRYHDEPRKFVWNTFNLLEYAGLIPSLADNIRTRTTVVWEDNYLVYDRRIANHVFDSENRLIRYEITDTDGSTALTSHAIQWSCGNPTVKNWLQ